MAATAVAEVAKRGAAGKEEEAAAEAEAAASSTLVCRLTWPHGKPNRDRRVLLLDPPSLDGDTDSCLGLGERCGHTGAVAALDDDDDDDAAMADADTTGFGAHRGAPAFEFECSPASSCTPSSAESCPCVAISPRESDGRAE